MGGRLVTDVLERAYNNLIDEWKSEVALLKSLKKINSEFCDTFEDRIEILDDIGADMLWVLEALREKGINEI